MSSSSREAIRAHNEYYQNIAENRTKEYEKMYKKLTNRLSDINELSDSYIKLCYYSLRKKFVPRTFTFRREPTLQQERKELNINKNIIVELFSNSKKEERLKLENQAKINHDQKLDNYYKEKEEAERRFLQEEQKRKNEVDDFNRNLMTRYDDFKAGDKDEINFMLTYFFEDELFRYEIDDEKYIVENKWLYNSDNNELYLESKFPSSNIFTTLNKICKFDRKNDLFEYKKYSPSEINYILECNILQLTLLRLYMIFFHFPCIKSIIVNSYVRDISPYTGQPDNINMLAAKINRNEIIDININMVDTKLFFKTHGARFSSKMVDLRGITPMIPYNKSEREKPNNIDCIDKDINGFEFEKFSELLLLANGFENIEITKMTGDYGADVIAWKDDIKYAIQCKKYSSSVGTSAVKEVIGSMSIYNCHVGVVLTNNYFTLNAKKLAESNNILLWDRNKLKEMIKKMN